MSQCKNVLAALQRGERITPLDALERWGCMRLGARIWQLKREGHDIQERLVEANGKHFSEYWLEEPRRERIGATTDPRHDRPAATLFGDIGPTGFRE